MASSTDITIEVDKALVEEIARLRCAIQTAIDYANGRESEWGERAEGAFAVLYSALENENVKHESPMPVGCSVPVGQG